MNAELITHHSSLFTLHSSLIVSALLAFSFLALSCSQVKTLSPADVLSADEQLEYLVLAAIAPEPARDYSSASTARARADFLDWFWSQRAEADPLPRTTYLDRARIARDHFGQLDLFNDDRVLTYVRLGPARREQYQPRPIETETTRTFVNPAETWTYEQLGYQFDFVKSGTAFKLVGQTRFGPAFFPPAFEEVDLGRSAPEPRAGALRFDLDLSLGRLRQVADSVEVEVQFGVAHAALSSLPEPDDRLLHVRLDITPRATGRPARRAFWAGYPADTGWVTARQTFWLPADRYRLAVTLTRPEGRAFATRTAELNLIDYVRRQQPCSDVLFYALMDSTFQSPQFQRPDWQRVIPLPGRRVPAGSTFYVLYEVYNLALDSAGGHRLEAVHELLARETRKPAVVPVPSRFITGSGTTAVVGERVHTMDLRPGPYLLVSRVKDLNSGRPASLTAEFEIAPRLP